MDRPALRLADVAGAGEGHPAHRLRVRLADRAIAAGTRSAVSAAIRAEGPYAITGDAQFKPLLDSLKPESSKAVLVHVGRAIGVAASLPGAPSEARQIASLMDDMKAIVVTSEEANEFVVRAAATGLPDVPNLVQAAMRMETGRRSTVRVQISEPRRIERPRARRADEGAPAPQKP